MSLQFLVLVLVVFTYSGSARAQVSPVTWNASDLSHISRIISGTPGITTIGVTGGVQAVATGSVPVMTSGGLRIPVPLSAVATVGNVSLAGAARLLVRAAGPIGAAYTGYEVYKALQDLGVTTCAPPDFFCKSTASGYNGLKDFVVSGWSAGGTFTTPELACTAYINNFYAPLTFLKIVQQSGSTNWWDCFKSNDGVNRVTFVGSTTPATGSATVSPATDAEFDAATLDKLANSTLGGKKLFDAVRLDNLRQKTLSNDQIVPPTSSVVVTAPPQVTPQTVIKTETGTLPNGDPFTRQYKETTTVSTTQTGSTIADYAPVFNTSSSTVISTTNNTTNNTTNETSTVNAPPATQKVELPTDYAREATTQKIVDALDTSGAPTLADQETRIGTAKTQAETDLGNMRTQAQADQDGAAKSMWFSWVWTPPVGTCSPYAGSVHGYAVSFDMCPTIANIRDVLGWLFALLGAIEVYGTLFRRND